MTRRLTMVVGMALTAGATGVPVQAAPLPTGVAVVATVPDCSHARLGRVSVTLGDKDTTRGGRISRGVGYAAAFPSLALAAKERGADAVVLRGHEAAYVNRGARPAYIALQGTAIRLEPAASCALEAIDPVEFEQRARDGDRIDVTTDNKHF